MRETIGGLHHQNTFEEELEIIRKDFPVKTPDTIATQLCNSLEMSKQIGGDLETTQKDILSERDRENKVQRISVESHVPLAELRQIFDAAIPRASQQTPDPLQGVAAHEDRAARLRSEAQMETIFGGMREIYNQNQLIRQAQEAMASPMQTDPLTQIIYNTNVDQRSVGIDARSVGIDARSVDARSVDARSVQHNQIAHHAHIHNEHLSQMFYSQNQIQQTQFNQFNQVNNTLVQQMAAFLNRGERRGRGGGGGDGGGDDGKRLRITDDAQPAPPAQLALPPPVPKAAVPAPTPWPLAVARSKAKAKPKQWPLAAARSKAKAKPRARRGRSRSPTREAASSSGGPAIYYIGE